MIMNVCLVFPFSFGPNIWFSLERLQQTFELKVTIKFLLSTRTRLQRKNRHART